MQDESNLQYFGQIKPKKLTSFEEDFKVWRSEIHANQARWAQYGTNSSKKAALMESRKVEELTRERFPESDLDY